MRTTALVLSLALASAVQAGAVIKINSTDSARVSIAGEEVGLTPVIIRDLKPGKYEVRVENMRTGQVQSYNVNSPRAGTVEREIAVAWQQTEPVVQVAPVAPVIVQQPVVVQPAPALVPVHAAPPVPAAEIAEDAAADAAAQQKAERERSRVRARNVVLGAALANEVFNKGKSKKTLRKVAVGGGLLNEALNR